MVKEMEGCLAHSYGRLIMLTSSPKIAGRLCGLLYHVRHVLDIAQRRTSPTPGNTLVLLEGGNRNILHIIFYVCFQLYRQTYSYTLKQELMKLLMYMCIPPFISWLLSFCSRLTSTVYMLASISYTKPNICLHFYTFHDQLSNTLLLI